MLEYKLFKIKLGSFRFLIERLRDGKVTASALCRNMYDVERTKTRLEVVR